MVRGEEGGAASSSTGVNSNEVPFTEIKSFPRRSQGRALIAGDPARRGEMGPALPELLQASQQSNHNRGVAAGARSERLRGLGKPRE